MKREFDMAEFLEMQENEQVASNSSLAQGLTVEVVRTPPEFASLAKEWDTLLEHSDATVFQSHEWLFCWWRHFGAGNGRALHIVLFRRSRTLIGIAPFFMDAQRFFRFHLKRRLRLMGCDIMNPPFAAHASEGGPSDYSDIIACRGDEETVAAKLIQYFQDQCRIVDVVECKNVSEESTMFRWVVPLLGREKVRLQARKTDVCPRLSVRSSFDELVQTFHSDLRRRLRHSLNDFQQAPIHTLAYVNSSQELEIALRELITLHQLRWNRLGYLGLFSDSRFEAFQYDVTQAFFAKGWLWFGTASMGGVCIGARMGFKFHKRVYDYLSGFDDRQPWGKSRPGLALLGMMIKDAIESGCTMVDFLRGSESYKFEFTSRSVQNWSFFISLSETERPLLIIFSRVLQALQHAYRKISKELLIMQVHIKEHGILAFPNAYSQFLVKRFISVFKIPVVPGRRSFLLRRVLGQNHQGAASQWGERIKRFIVDAEKFVDDGISRLTARAYLWRCNNVGRGARTQSKPVIQNRGHIGIGRNFSINSRESQADLIAGIEGRIEIGDNVHIESGATVFAQRLITIGNSVRIGQSVSIADSDADSPEQWYSAMTAEPIVIGDAVKLERGTSILKGVTIGRGSIIKEGSIVSTAIPPHVVAGGVPARVLYHRTNPEDYQMQGPQELTMRIASEEERFQKLVDEHFQLTASYWKATYDARDLEGKIYQRRLAVVLAMIDNLKLPPDTRVLEVGCGAGLLTIGLARRGFIVEAIDSADSMVSCTQEEVLETGFRDRVTVRKADIHKLDYENEAFDMVIAVGVMPWLHSPEYAMQEMARVAKSQGLLIITADNEWRFDHALDPRFHPLLAPLRRWVKQVLQKVGVTNENAHPQLAQRHTITHINRLLLFAGMQKVQWTTVGFGPFTLWGKKVFSELMAMWLNQTLQGLADRRFPVLRSTGSHYIVLAQKRAGRGA